MEKITRKATYFIFKDDTVSKGIIEEAEGQEVQFNVRSRLLPQTLSECIFLKFHFKSSQLYFTHKIKAPLPSCHSVQIPSLIPWVSLFR